MLFGPLLEVPLNYYLKANSKIIMGVGILGVDILKIDIREVTFWELTFWEVPLIYPTYFLWNSCMASSLPCNATYHNLITNVNN